MSSILNGLKRYTIDSKGLPFFANDGEWLHVSDIRAAEAELKSLVAEQKKTIEVLMCGMPNDGTTPVIRRIAELQERVALLDELTDRQSKHIIDLAHELDKVGAASGAVPEGWRCALERIAAEPDARDSELHAGAMRKIAREALSASPQPAVAEKTNAFGGADYDRLYQAWHSIGADVAGLEWSEFVTAYEKTAKDNPVMFNGLPEAETNATASVAGLHGGRPMSLRECMEAEEKPAPLKVPSDEVLWRIYHEAGHEKTPELCNRRFAELLLAEVQKGGGHD